jgi:multicomponent K+:H+ antiporter subunit A
VAGGGREAFLRFTDLKLRTAATITATINNGSLQRNLTLLVLLAILAGSAPYLARGAAVMPVAMGATPANAAIVAVWAIGVAAALGATIAFRRRLVALVLLGAVGLVVSLAFVFLSAPDLALTQLLVEMATIILMMLALRWLPADSAVEPGRWRKARDAVLALAGGTGLAALAYALMTRPFDSIAGYFLDTAVGQGGGANVVNVILVDYRGFDTLGEITVLGIAGVVIHALLAAHEPPPAAAGSAGAPSLFLALVARLLLPLTALLSIYLFLRGHNAPGGGFIAQRAGPRAWPDRLGLAGRRGYGSGERRGRRAVPDEYAR